MSSGVDTNYIIFGLHQGPPTISTISSTYWWFSKNIKCQCWACLGKLHKPSSRHGVPPWWLGHFHIFRAFWRLQLQPGTVNSPYHLQGGAPKIAKLVNITPISLWFMIPITIVAGVYKPTNIAFGGPTLCSITIKSPFWWIKTPWNPSPIKPHDITIFLGKTTIFPG